MSNLASKLLTWTQRVAILDAIDDAHAHLGVQADKPITINQVHLIVGDDWPEGHVRFAHADDICAVTGEINALGDVTELRAAPVHWQCVAPESGAYINVDYAYEIYKDDQLSA